MSEEPKKKPDGLLKRLAKQIADHKAVIAGRYTEIIDQETEQQRHERIMDDPSAWKG